MDDKERMIYLVGQAKNHDPSAFASLYEMIYQDMYRMALYSLKNPEDAENAVSDAVLDAYAGLDRLRDDGAFRSWIFRILSNKCSRYIREYMSRRQMESSESVDEYADRLPSGDEGIQTAENRVMVKDAFAILSDEERQIVSLTVYGGYDSAEVADIMKINRNTVRSKYSRAITKMKDRMTKTEA